MITIEPYSDKYKAAWDEFVSSRPEATVAHPIVWRQVISEELGHQPCYLLALEGTVIRGVLPLFLVKTWWGTKSFISIPWIDYGGVLADADEPKNLLLAEAKSMAVAEKATFIEYRSVDPVAAGLPIRTEKVTFELGMTEDAEELWKSFHFKLRNHIRKAEKSGLKAEIGGLDKLPEFYKVFCWKMHQLGTPVWGYSFFESILTNMKDSAQIVLARKDGEAIAGALVLSFADRLYIPSAASYSHYLKFRPNHAMYWEVIRKGCEQGYKCFDFGRSTIDSNTFTFKKQWVPTPTQLHWQYDLNLTDKIPAVNPDNPKYRLMINGWRKMPLALANWLGPKVIRNFP